MDPPLVEAVGTPLEAGNRQLPSKLPGALRRQLGKLKRLLMKLNAVTRAEILVRGHVPSPLATVYKRLQNYGHPARVANPQEQITVFK